jgi:ferric-dicitrate binding protein FerR (iron transport regulator)
VAVAVSLVVEGTEYPFFFMANLVTFEAYLRYSRHQASAAEARAVRAWLANPANASQAHVWMTQYAQLLEQEGEPEQMPDFEAVQADLLVRLGLAPAPPKRRRRTTYWAAAAALIIGLLAGSAWLWQTRPTPALATELTTHNGELRTVQLPDGSSVTLNANSRLRYAAAWPASGPREVWVDGEAFFSVKHLPNNQRFRVHTTGNFTVEVLGTKFTVYRRHAQARVVLLSGKVRVDFDDHRQPDVLLKPGELLQTADARPRQLVHHAVQTPQYAAWTEKKMVFKNTPIAELATQLRDTYGIVVEVTDPAMSRQKITGTVPLGDLDLLCQTLEASFQFKVVRQDGRIVLSPR